MSNKQAEAFLRFFEGRHTFQTFDDKGVDRSLAGHNSADFEEIESKLLDMNKRGAGVFFTVNETDGKGRKAENITRVRAIFVDLDGADAREKLAQVMSASIPPSLVVESSEQKFHCYWLVDTCSAQEFPAIQKALARKFGGDPAVHDIARVMRIPGFVHNKGNPFRTHLLEATGETYKIQDIISGLGLELFRQDNPPVEHKINGFPAGERNESMFKYAASLRARGVAIEEAQVLMKEQAKLCKPPMDYREMMKCLAQGYKYEEGHSEEFSKKKKNKTPTASREDYFRLFEEILGKLPRDIFTGNCMVHREGIWLNAWNMLDKVKSEAECLTTAQQMTFRQTIIESHFFEYEDRKKPELIIDIPKWDGVDHIRAYTDCLVLDGSQKFPKDIIERYTKAWIAGVFRKLEDPRYQNPILILRSKKQGIGKDTWVNALTDGFGQWASHFNITQNERDNYLELSHSAVLKIGEFDKTTSKHEMNVIKDMIFRDTTRLRASHAKKAEHRICRASFIATCNPEDFYRDPTGHRRFAVFNLQRIDFNYSRSPETSLQILAQAKHLAESRYTIPQMHIDSMMEFLEGKTPQSDDDFIVDSWVSLCAEIINPDILARGWLTNIEATKLGIFERIVKLCGFRLKTIQTVLKARGFSRNERITGVMQRGYALETVSPPFETDPEESF